MPARGIHAPPGTCSSSFIFKRITCTGALLGFTNKNLKIIQSTYIISEFKGLYSRSVERNIKDLKCKEHTFYMYEV